MECLGKRLRFKFLPKLNCFLKVVLVLRVASKGGHVSVTEVKAMILILPFASGSVRRGRHLQGGQNRNSAGQK